MRILACISCSFLLCSCGGISEALKDKHNLDVSVQYAKCFQQALQHWTKFHIKDDKGAKKTFKALLLPCSHINKQYFLEDIENIRKEGGVGAALGISEENQTEGKEKKREKKK